MYNNKDNLNTFAVYCHYFPNGKVYVGLTCHCDDIEEKRFGHNGYKYNKQPLVYRAIQKYGWDNIQHEIIAKYVSRESAVNIEKDLIALHKSNERDHGYNISPGGEDGSYHSEESRKKMSEQRRGKKKSEEHRRKIGESNRGRVMSAETRKKIADKARGRKHDTMNDPRNMPVLQYRISDGSFVGRYISLNEAARETNASISHISECAKNKRRQEMGCVWVYENMATEEYISLRLDKARMHSLYQPVKISNDLNSNEYICFETKALAAKYIGSTSDTVNKYINSNLKYKGYYINSISVDEYLNYTQK